MLRLLNRNATETDAKLAALNQSNAVIEFNLDGTILTANENFLQTTGYTLADLQGQHHSLFVDPSSRDHHDYKEFWQRLREGEYQAGRYKRFGKGGREIWIEASYNPLLGQDGTPFKIVKFATDITRQMQEQADLKGQVEAIGKSQAVIAFDLKGRILDANANLLAAVGYTLEDIRGQHHSMLVEPSLRASPEYQAFWDRLKAGEYQSGQYKRIGKGGRAVWIEASYNPILDASVRPYKVVKYATDVTRQVSLLIDLHQIVDSNFS
jgi:methyl-accepting chemotaxis protein